MNNPSSLALTWFRTTLLVARAGLGAGLLMLGACSVPQSIPEAEASPETSSTSPSAQSEGAPKDHLPSEITGTFDISQEACSSSLTTSRLSVTQNKLQFYYGFADIDAITFRDKGYDIDATLVHQEGQIEVRPEATTYRIEPDGQENGIRFVNTSTEEEPWSLVRCAEPDTQPTDEGTDNKDSTEPDKTTELSFASRTSSATVSDTLVGFAIHDYLVQASAGQTLKATLTTGGPA